MQKRTGKDRLVSSAMVSTLVLFSISISAAVAATSKPSAAPGPIVGTWSRTVTAKDVARVTGTTIAAGSKWKLIIQKNGNVIMMSPTPGQAWGSTGSSLVKVGPNKVHFDSFEHYTNTYRWKVTNNLLTFTKISDPNDDNYVLLVGVWKKH